ncbi:hypothetical protein ACWDTP_34295, partial [Mycobacterium sp. NPDC003449]
PAMTPSFTRDEASGLTGAIQVFFYTGTHVCCCTLCHGDHVWDIRPGKRQRIEGRRACRDWQRDY